MPKVHPWAIPLFTAIPYGLSLLFNSIVGKRLWPFPFDFQLDFLFVFLAFSIQPQVFSVYCLAKHICSNVVNDSELKLKYILTNF